MAHAQANMAVVAHVFASFVSKDRSLEAINSGIDPRNSHDLRHDGYGNWPHVGTEWVEYGWLKPISTNKIDVYWLADGQGIKLPGACRLLYWDGKMYVPVPNAQGLGVAGNRYNTTTFDEVTTTRLRLVFDSAAKGLNFSTGILQWNVYDSGKSPDFPPIVTAGPDRTVVVSGKTFLSASVKSAKNATAGKMKWEKVSGAGEVSFADASAAATTAAFSALGDYVLRFTAGDGELAASDTLRARVIPVLSGGRLDPVPVSVYKINSKFWNDRIKNLIINWIPHCYMELSDLHLKEGGIANFIEAGKKLRGEPAARHVGSPWVNAYVHNTVESMCLALMVDSQGDQEIIEAQKAMRAKLDEWIPIILSAQEPDGYLQTRFTLDLRNPPHWNPRTRGEHEGYVAGYFIESAIAEYRMTGGKDMRMYDAAKRLADCWYDHIGPPPKQEWFDGHEEIEQALVRFSRLVDEVEGAEKGAKYVELARFLMDCRGDGSAYDQSYATATHQYVAAGHAVRAAYLYSAMADIVGESGDIDYQSAVQSIWDDLVNRKYYITGGIGSGATAEGFGRDYSLPNNAYCESCSGCGELFFQYNLNLAYHDARYADLYEQTLYNAILGDLDLEGKNFYYQNPLETDGQMRYPWHDCPCCVGNIPRTMLQLPTWMYSTGKDSNGNDGLWVNLFVGSTVTVPDVAGQSVQMVQTTDYPWSEKVSILVNPASAKNFSIHIREPRRDVSALYVSTPNADGISSISLNGAAVQPTMEEGYAVINRTWTPGDKIELTLPLVPQRIMADERIAADRSRVALRYGPLIYNIEAADQPKLDVPLIPSSPLTAEWRGDLLGGVMVIKGTFADGSPMLAIPNYARCNRGGRSLVWMRFR